MIDQQDVLEEVHDVAAYDPAKPDEDPVDVAAIVSALLVPEGDFRDWPEIRRWATEIATVAAIAWNAFGGRRDLDRRRQGGRDPGAPD